MDGLTKIAGYAGPIALAAFAGVFLGGLALSFFWKNFGPWKLLESAKAELDACHAAHDIQVQQNAQHQARIAELEARYGILLAAVQAAGLGLQIGRIEVNLPKILAVEEMKSHVIPRKPRIKDVP